MLKHEERPIRTFSIFLSKISSWCICLRQTGRKKWWKHAISRRLKSWDLSSFISMTRKLHNFFLSINVHKQLHSLNFSVAVLVSSIVNLSKVKLVATLDTRKLFSLPSKPSWITLEYFCLKPVLQIYNKQ